MKKAIIAATIAIIATLTTSCESTKEFASEMAKKSTVAIKGDAWAVGISNGGFFGTYDIAAARAAKAARSGKQVIQAK